MKTEGRKNKMAKWKKTLEKVIFPQNCFYMLNATPIEAVNIFIFFFYNQHLPKSVEMKKRKFNRIYLNRKKVCPVFVRLPFAIHVKILLPVEIRSKFFIWYLCHQIIWIVFVFGSYNLKVYVLYYTHEDDKIQTWQ